MNNKVYVLPPGEDWIVDRFVNEWNEDNPDISVSDPEEADVLWLLSDWCWRKLDAGLLKSKKVLTTVHHIVPSKFGWNERNDFLMRDSITNVYHVYNQTTYDFIRPLTSKPIHLVTYWANQKIWVSTGEKTSLREKHGLPVDKFLIGSFQRDTEGNDLRSPKLEKGPDLLANFMITKHKSSSDGIHVVLAGWRRQYVMTRLKAENVPFTYVERPPHDVVNDLYQCLDLYPVTARQEGGPQSLIECGLLGVPVVSRDVGIARQVLAPESISDDVMNASPSVPNVESWKLPMGYSGYRDLISTL